MLATTSKLPEGYSFRYRPSLMQRYVASKVYQLPHFGNFSDTGAGKTLSAILASRVLDSKVTLIVCPNDVVEQWSKVIVEVFPNSKVITGKPAFYWKHDGKASYTYLVINYDKFSQNNSKYLVALLVKQKIDFIVLDEIHFIKKRDDSVESKRREVLGNLLTMARKRNNEVKTLGMSATPVINNLEEGKSLLAYITNKVYDDLANRSTIFNAMALHEKLSLISIREIPRYKANIEYKEWNVVAVKPPHIRARDLKRHPLLIEQILTEARIPEIIKRIEDKTIIYTEYVTGIVKEILVDAVKNAGHSYIQYTGDTKDPLEKFIDPKQNIQVLIASSPISIGVDGLQEVCSNLIINTLPWTNAQFRQIIGRLHRTGQKHTVNVHIIKASISGYEYDEAKWTRIEIKRTLADCAVDGRIPIGLLQSKEQMYNELIMWLERLERNEISTFKRRDLNMQLTSIELEHAKRTISEFGLLNRQINKEYSQTTHERIQQAPSILLDYHDKLDTAKTFWGFNPVNVIADKINLGLNIPKCIVMKQK
jgi:superfamily II DNA or RNA helicase